MVVFYILVSLVHATTAQFPTHLDLQKVGEIVFDNEKYNLLKPTSHKITDHFEDVMLRRENVNRNERIFIDDNGFRHFWGGLGVRYKNLRKTDISLYEINKENQINQQASKQENAATDVTDTKLNIENTTQKAKKRPKRPKTSREEDEAEKAALRQDAAKTTLNPETGAGAGKKVAITSFFCPFFGVVTMTSFID